jgi:hypothetical protein
MAIDQSSFNNDLNSKESFNNDLHSNKSLNNDLNSNETYNERKRRSLLRVSKFVFFVNNRFMNYFNN